MQACDRTGHFRAEVLDCGLKKMDSGAVAAALHFKLTEVWDDQTETWHPWAEYDMEAYGDVWLVKKDGVLNDKSAQRLINVLGWDGSFASFADGAWQPKPCQVQIEKEEYKGQTYYKAAWINQFDAVPGQGQLGNVDADGLKQLDARFGSPLRALAGNVRRNTVPAASKPPAPPPPVPAGAANGDGIPF